MLGVFAEFDTNLRRERQLECIANAKAAGVYSGRPASIDVTKVREMKSRGMGASGQERPPVQPSHVPSRRVRTSRPNGNGAMLGDVHVVQPLCSWPRFLRHCARWLSQEEASMSKGRTLTTLLAVCALVLTSAFTPAAARWWRGGYFYRSYGPYSYRFEGHSLRPPAGQIWVRGFRNAPTRQARLRQDFQLDGAYR
jgi:hypothetical protein